MMFWFVDKKISQPRKKTKITTARKMVGVDREKDLVKACLQYLAFKGYVAIRNNTGVILIEKNNKVRAVRNGFVGSSDIIACGPNGKFVAIECKTGKGKVTERQSEFLGRISKLGGIAIIVRSVDELHQKIEEIFGK